MKWNKIMKYMCTLCLSTLLIMLFCLPVMAEEGGAPQLLVTKGNQDGQINIALSGMGSPTIKGLSLKLKLTNATFTGALTSDTALKSEDARVKILPQESGEEATLAVTRDGQLPLVSGVIAIGTLTVTGQAGVDYSIAASDLEMVDALTYAKTVLAVVKNDSKSESLSFEKKPAEGANPSPSVQNPGDMAGGGTSESGSVTETVAETEGRSGNPGTGILAAEQAIPVVLGIFLIALSGAVALSRKNRINQ
ncbi:hypothetical protein [Eubacterium aggregans]|uniref:hypothetical protein n=1 Tax=Eubacterium aggregans TaxID=81409 RepID=UPI003F3A4699